MINNFTIIWSINGIAIMLLLILLFSFRNRARYGKNNEKVFYFMICINIAQAALETLTFYIDGKTFENCVAISSVLNSLSFIGTAVYAFSWFNYCMLTTFRKEKIRPSICFLTSIPFIIVVVGSIINVFTPVFFTITAENVYIRSSIYIIPAVENYLYVLGGSFALYYNRKRSTDYLFIPSTLFLIPVAITSIIQIADSSFSLFWIGGALGLCSVYINILEEGSDLDTLSGTYTRKYMNQYLELCLHRSNREKHLTGIMIDIDKFKHINDSFGHRIGDDAIECTGELLRRSVRRKGIVSRYGGDEFVILLDGKDENEAAELTEIIKYNAEIFNSDSQKDYMLAFSYGIASYRQDDTIADFINRMDKALYDNKSQKT